MENKMEKENRTQIEKFKNEGYKDRFKFDNGQLVDTDNQNRFNPDDIHVEEEQKLEVNGKPSDQTILIVFRTRNHTKGLYVIDQKATENLELKEFFKTIPDDPSFPSKVD